MKGLGNGKERLWRNRGGGFCGIIADMKSEAKISRRGFVGGALAAGASFGFPAVVRAEASGGKVRMAFVGVGNQGFNDFSQFLHYPELVETVALCDTEIDGPRTRKAIAAAPDAPRFKDYREMFDKCGGRIDAVCVATPDFSHVPIAIEALARNIAVYCEKPLAASFAETQLMMDAAAKSKAVTQMGNQGHSLANYWQFKTLVESGYVKDVTRITAHMNYTRRWHKWNGALKGLEEEPVPEWLDWRLWNAQRPMRPFNHEYVDGGWRCFWTLGNGALGDWGPHIFDAAHEFLKLGLPEKITFRGEGCNDLVFPMASTIFFHFPARAGMPPCVIEWRDGVSNKHGVDAKVTAPKWQMPACGAELYLADGRVFARGAHDDPVRLVAGGDPDDPAVKKTLRAYPRGKPSHHRSFLLAVKGEDRTTSPFSVGGPLSQVLSLGVIAQRLRAPELKFDAKAKRFIGNDAANALLEAPSA